MVFWGDIIPWGRSLYHDLLDLNFQKDSGYQENVEIERELQEWKNYLPYTWIGAGLPDHEYQQGRPNGLPYLPIQQ